MPIEYFRLLLQRQVFEVEGLARTDADAGEFRADVRFHSVRRAANCSAKSRYSKKFVFASSLLIFGK